MAFPRGCELISFADDLVLMCTALDITQLETKVNTAVALITDWGRSIKLSFNEAKTQAMIFTKTRQLPTPNFYMNGALLETVNSFRYLGVILDNKFTWRKHLTHVQQKAIKLISTISAVTRNTWGLSSEVTAAIYKAVIEPVVFYAVEAWNPALKYTERSRVLIY